MQRFLVLVFCFLISFAQGDPVIFSDYYTFSGNLASSYFDNFDNLGEGPTYQSSGDGFLIVMSNSPSDDTWYGTTSESLCYGTTYQTSPGSYTDIINIAVAIGNPTAFGGWFSCVNGGGSPFDCGITIIIDGTPYMITTTNSNPSFWAIGLPTHFSSVQIAHTSPVSYYLAINFMIFGIYSANGGTPSLPSFCTTAVSGSPGTTTTVTTTTTTTSTTTTPTTTTSTTSGITTTTTGSTSTSGGSINPKLTLSCYNLTATVSKELLGTPQYFTLHDFGCNTTDWSIVSVNTTTLYSYQDPNQVKLVIQPSLSGVRPVHYQIMSSDNQYIHNVVTKINIVNHRPVAGNVTFTWNYPRTSQTFPNWNLLTNSTDQTL